MNAGYAMWMVWSLALIMTGLGMWGQYWYDKAHRQADAIAFMLEEEINNATDSGQPEG